MRGENACLWCGSLIKDAYRLGGRPFVLAREDSAERDFDGGRCGTALLKLFDWELTQMEAMDAYIGIRGNANIAELADADETDEPLL